MGREVRQTGSSDILVMPEGNGDMQTIPAKKTEVYPFFSKNFDCAHS
jgi:hypothetical protein